MSSLHSPPHHPYVSSIEIRSFSSRNPASLALARESIALPLCLLSPDFHSLYPHANHHPSPALPHLQLQSSEQLLTQMEQLKRLHVLQDFEALNTELDQDVRALEAR